MFSLFIPKDRFEFQVSNVFGFVKTLVVKRKPITVEELHQFLEDIEPILGKIDEEKLEEFPHEKAGEFLFYYLIDVSPATMDQMIALPASEKIRLMKEMMNSVKKKATEFREKRVKKSLGQGWKRP